MQLSHYPAKLQPLQDNLFGEKAIQLSVLRLDELHPVVSGNKLFKLQLFLKQAVEENKTGVLTFGGPYSNHLVATAFAARENDLKSVGFVRGEQPAILSHTLEACDSYGMKLQFITRDDYAKKFEPGFLNDIFQSFPNHLVIPEGGYDPLGSQGAARIMDEIPAETTHICCAVGTATTVAGLLLGAKPNQKIVAFSALRGLSDFGDRVQYLTGLDYKDLNLELVNEYDFGGYAKKNQQLFDFMNQFYLQYQIPTDMIYTAKMMFGVMQRIRENFFPPGSKIVCVHTGGLQGNQSLPAGTLVFD